MLGRNNMGTLSKFGRLHFDDKDEPIGDVDAILSELKSMERSHSRRRSFSNRATIPNRLLNKEPIQRKPRKYLRSKTKITKPPPTIPQATFKNDSSNEVPAPNQYDPDFKNLLSNVPGYSFTSPDKAMPVSHDIMTLNEMINAWQSNIRIIDIKKEAAKVAPVEEEKKKPIVQKPKIIDEDEKEEEEEPEKVPPKKVIKEKKKETEEDEEPKYQPGELLNISRDLDKPRVISFVNQSSRPEIDPGPDRTHFNLAASIDAVKPRSIYHILPPKLCHSDQEVKKDSVWEEIEKEQQTLMNVLTKQNVDVEKETPKKKVKREKIPVRDDRGPFDHLIHREAPDVEYDVESSLKSLESTRILPRTNFGRRLDDSDRAIYAKSEATDAIYPNTNVAWLKTQPNHGVAPSMDLMHYRKTAYDYMPKTCGGHYTDVPQNLDKRTGISFALMGKRKYMLDIPPQFTQPRASSSLINQFN